MARFDLSRTVEDMRRVGGDEVAAVVERVYGGDSESVTREEWAPCWKLFGPWVIGDEERARTVVNVDLNARGLAVMGEFDVRDRVGPRQVSDVARRWAAQSSMTTVAVHREIVDALPAGVV